MKLSVELFSECLLCRIDHVHIVSKLVYHVGNEWYYIKSVGIVVTTEYWI